MQLHSTGDSLFIPALLGNVVWEDQLGHTVKVNVPAEACMLCRKYPGLLDRVVDSIPQWLYYDKKEVIECDLRYMLENMKAS